MTLLVAIGVIWIAVAVLLAPAVGRALKVAEEHSSSSALDVPDHPPTDHETAGTATPVLHKTPPEHGH